MQLPQSNQHFTFHVLSLPHSQTTKEYDSCAFTAKCRKFSDMMKSLGHTVYLYASEDNEANCDELITCITKKEQKDFLKVFGPNGTANVCWDVSKKHWQVFNHNATENIKKLIQPRDFIGVVGGTCHKPVTDSFPNIISVELGIGHTGSYAKYRVFESYAWMHTIYGREQDLGSARGNSYDRVIPGYLEEELFPYYEKPDEYYLFVGRLIELKGWKVAVEVCKELGVKLVVAGLGGDEKYLPSWVDYRGLIGTEERGRLMSKARALFAPTLYVEPFGNVVAEAMMCGTPVITTDWGAFPELVRQGVDGFRCRTFQEFLDATKDVAKLDRKEIRRYAIERFSMKNVRWQYQKYFEDLSTLWDKGWYTRKENVKKDFEVILR